VVLHVHSDNEAPAALSVGRGFVVLVIICVPAARGEGFVTLHPHGALRVAVPGGARPARLGCTVSF
jgi:hypothetical protein